MFLAYVGCGALACDAFGIFGYHHFRDGVTTCSVFAPSPRDVGFDGGDVAGLGE